MATRKSLLLRINADLWREIEAWAQDELRSVNGQIEYMLRQAVRRRRGRAGGPAHGRHRSKPRRHPGP